MILVCSPAIREEAMYVGEHLREEDEREVRAAAGRAPSRVLSESFSLSREVMALYRHGSPNPFAVCGVRDDETTEGLGVVWMLCTPEVSRVALSLAKLAPELAQHLGRRYPLGLHNLAHKPNYLHVRWCRLAGFVELGEHTINGHPFIHIYRAGDHV